MVVIFTTLEACRTVAASPPRRPEGFTKNRRYAPANHAERSCHIRVRPKFMAHRATVRRTDGRVEGNQGDRRVGRQAHPQISRQATEVLWTYVLDGSASGIPCILNPFAGSSCNALRTWDHLGPIQGAISACASGRSLELLRNFGLPAVALQQVSDSPPPPGLRRATFAWIMREGWRRRPDLNRGWRFCRQGRDVYLVDSSCFLVGPTPPFSPVFGRYCSQIVPKSGDSERQEALSRLRSAHDQIAVGIADGHRAFADPPSNC